MSRLLPVYCLACLLSSLPLSGGVILITPDKTQWISAVGSYQTEDFNDAIIHPDISYSGNMGALDIPVFRDWVAPGEGFGIVFFDAPVIGAGADWDLSPSGPGVGVMIIVYYEDGSEETLGQEVPNTYTGQFFGFVTDKPFVQITYTGGSQQYSGLTDYSAETLALDNLVFSPETAGGGPAGEVPEPATWALLGGALLGLAAWRHRQARSVALVLVLAAAVPCSAGTVRVTLSGEWTTTGTTPVNNVTLFSASFEIDQSPTPSHVGATSFNAAVTFALVNGGTITRSGLAGWVDNAGTYLIDFRAYDIAASGDYLQAIGSLPVPTYTGTNAAPTLLIMDQATTVLNGYYYPDQETMYINLFTNNGRYLVELLDSGDPGTPGAEVPEPATWALLGGGLLGLAAWKRRVHGAALR